MTIPPRQTQRAAAWRGLAALALVAATAGCGTKSPDVTGVTVTAVFSGVAVDQLELSVSTSQGVAFTPKRRPENAHGQLKTPQSVSIYLRDGLAREKATVTVTAYWQDGVVATGTGTADLALHKLVPVLVQLEASSADGSAPADGAVTDAGDGPADTAAETGAAGQDGGSESPPSLKANGVACTSKDECESALCVDGVCCASACDGLCEACNLPNNPGTCSPEPDGTAAPGVGPTSCVTQPATGCGFDGKCDGNGNCRHYKAGVPCKADYCVAGMPAYQPGGACDGQGTCVVPLAVDCTPYVCDLSGGTPACRSMCRAGQADCQSPAVCDAAGSCGAKPLKANGAGCAAGTECTSTHCVDGVCCAGACAGACTSCNQTGKEGMCLPVPAGKLDPRKICVDQGATSCGHNGLCDAAGGCAYYPTSTVCAAGACNRNQLHPARHCDGKGGCATVTDQSCVPYRCDTAKAACFTSCTSNAQCAQAPDRASCNNTGVCQ